MGFCPFFRKMNLQGHLPEEFYENGTQDIFSMSEADLIRPLGIYFCDFTERGAKIYKAQDVPYTGQAGLCDDAFGYAAAQYARICLDSGSAKREKSGTDKMWNKKRTADYREVIVENEAFNFVSVRDRYEFCSVFPDVYD